MITTLTIVLAVVIAVNVWLMISSAKREKQRRKLLQERIDEFDDTIGELTNNLGRAKERVREGQSLLASMKKDFQRLLAEHEDLKLSYQRAKAELAALKQDPHAEPQDPVDGGEPTVHDQPGEPAGKPLPDFKVDFDELRNSYEELAKSYNTISQKWKNPSKTYLVNHIIKAYNVRNQTALAKALGVDKSVINRMIK